MARTKMLATSSLNCSGVVNANEPSSLDPEDAALLVRLADEVVGVQELQCFAGAEDATAQPVSLVRGQGRLGEDAAWVFGCGRGGVL